MQAAIETKTVRERERGSETEEETAGEAAFEARITFQGEAETRNRKKASVFF